MPIRDEKTYAIMGFKDFWVAYTRLKNKELRLSAFRAYKSEKRMLKSLAMKHGLHRRDTKCAVPKTGMLKVAELLENSYLGIYEMTEKALSLFNQWKSSNVREEYIKDLLKNLNFEWINTHLDEHMLKKVEEIQTEIRSR